MEENKKEIISKEENTKSLKLEKIKFNILAIFAIVILSIALTPVTFQNDTYYTIAIGKHIAETGTIDMQDPFSWHENLPYTYPHWLYDLGTYGIYQLGENIGIGGFTAIYITTIILSCILGIVIYLACLKISKHHIVSFLITMGIMYLLKAFITARAQLVTFILFALTILFIEQFLNTKKKRYAIGLIIIPILIANLHVAVWPFYFVLYLPYVVQYVMVLVSKSRLGFRIRKRLKENKIKKLEKMQKNPDIIKNESKKTKNKISIEERIEKTKQEIVDLENRKNKSIENANRRKENPYKIVLEERPATKWLILILIICIFTGLLTPLGDTPYTYLAKTMEGNTTSNISEHLPLTLINNIGMIISIILVLALITFTDTKVRVSDLLMLGGLLLLAFISRRQVSMFYIIGGISFTKIISDFLVKYDIYGEDKVIKVINTIYGKVITISIVLIIALTIIRPKLNDKFVDETSYPVQAAEYILANMDLSTMRIYNEYNYGSYLVFKGIPVFIDSRAELYTPQFNGVKKDDKTYEGRDIFSDYLNISNIGTYYENKFEEYGITHVLLKKNTKLNIFISRDDNYKELYSDDYFVFYERLY